MRGTSSAQSEPRRSTGIAGEATLLSGYRAVWTSPYSDHFECVSAGEFTAIAAPKQRLIFGVLLDQAGRAVSADRLLDDVWSGQPPQGGLKALRYHVSKLRNVLVPDRVHGDEGPIRTVGSGYQLVVEPDEIDTNRFERLASDGARFVANQRWEEARRVLGEALSLWRGDALHDFRYEEFAQASIARLEERRLVCLEDLIESAARSGRPCRPDRRAERPDDPTSIAGTSLGAVDDRPLPRGQAGRSSPHVRDRVRRPGRGAGSRTQSCVAAATPAGDRSVAPVPADGRTRRSVSRIEVRASWGGPLSSRTSFVCSPVVDW